MSMLVILFTGRVSVQGVSLYRGSLSRGVSIQGVSVQGVSVQLVSVRETPPTAVWLCAGGTYPTGIHSC